MCYVSTTCEREKSEMITAMCFFKSLRFSLQGLRIVLLISLSVFLSVAISAICPSVEADEQICECARPCQRMRHDVTTRNLYSSYEERMICYSSCSTNVHFN